MCVCVSVCVCACVSERERERRQDNISVVDLCLNIDGLPIYRSTILSLWSIQCCISNPSRELKELMTSGLTVGDGKMIPVQIKSFICDAPARALIKGAVAFNSRHGCNFCEVCGKFDGRMIFLYCGAPRTNESFQNQSDEQHHKCASILLNLDIEMVQQFPIDPMHSIDLGVMKKIMMTWKEDPLPLRLSAEQINILTTYNCSLKLYIPSNFSRKPRGLNDLKLWKATEFRTFLLFCGPVILKYVLPKDKYLHFLSRSIALRILYNPTYVSLHKDYAQTLLSCFVENAMILYTDHLITYDFHTLNHLADLAQMYGSLDCIAAYPFENNMQK